MSANPTTRDPRASLEWVRLWLPSYIFSVDFRSQTSHCFQSVLIKLAQLREKFGKLAQLREKFGTLAQLREKFGTLAQLREKFGTLAQLREKFGTLAQLREKFGTLA